MRTIALEEHFASPGFVDGPGHELKEQALKFGAAAAKLFEQLCDVGEKRIAEMDAARIDVRVLSLTSPGTEQVEGDDAMALGRESNDSSPMQSKETQTGSLDLPRFQPRGQTGPPKNWNGWSATMASKER